MSIFKNETIDETTPMTMYEFTNMIANDELHIVFGDELCEHLLEVNVRFKGDNKRIITVRNVYKDGRNNQPIPHFYEPSLKYIYGNKYRHRDDNGLPIFIPEKFNGKIQIQGNAAKRYSVSDIDDTGKEIIKTFLKEDCNLLREYWFLNPDENISDANRMEELKRYFIDKYSSKHF